MLLAPDVLQYMSFALTFFNASSVQSHLNLPLDNVAEGTQDEIPPPDILEAPKTSCAPDFSVLVTADLCVVCAFSFHCQGKGTHGSLCFVMIGG